MQAHSLLNVYGGCFMKLFWLQAIMAEGKEHALAIGFTKLSAKDM